MKLNIFGKRTIEVVREGGEWVIYTLGEGKRLKSYDFMIPSHLSEEEMLIFVGDIYHEAATPENPDIKIIP